MTELSEGVMIDEFRAAERRESIISAMAVWSAVVVSQGFVMYDVAPCAVMPREPWDVAPCVKYNLILNVSLAVLEQVPWKYLVPFVVFALVQKLNRWPDWTRGPDCWANKSMFVRDGDVKFAATMEDVAFVVLKLRVKMGWSLRFWPTGR